MMIMMIVKIINNTSTISRLSAKTAVLGTSHNIRKVLQAETWSLSGGVHHWLKRKSTREERKPVTRGDSNSNNNNNISEEQSPYWEADSSASDRQIPPPFMELEVHEHVHKSSPPVPILSQMIDDDDYDDSVQLRIFHAIKTYY
jgi:hypothetical protein